MSFRETIEKRPGVTMGAALLIIVLTLFFMLHGRRAGEMAIPSSAFYSADDGATFFSDAADRVSPFDHQGTSAYRAMVYTCDGGKTRFVAYLQRLTGEARRRMDSSGKSSLDSTAMQRLGPADVEIKKPGANNVWINSGNLSRSGGYYGGSLPGWLGRDTVCSVII